MQALFYPNSDRIGHGMHLQAGGVIQSANGQHKLHYQVRRQHTSFWAQSKRASLLLRMNAIS
jgi:hypothetical protein